MLGETNKDWRTKRREDASADIVRTAWELARENGLAGMSLRDLARRLGMATPSLYSYFDSKHALYDAMFADGYRAFLSATPPVEATDLRTILRSGAQAYVDFAMEDPVRYLLLNQRSIPGFEPSAEAYALAQEAYERFAEPLRTSTGATQEDLDLIGAVIGGLISQQLSNEPGGTRWVRLLDDAVDLLVHRFDSKPTRAASSGGRRTARRKS